MAFLKVLTPQSTRTCHQEVIKFTGYHLISFLAITIYGWKIWQDDQKLIYGTYNRIFVGFCICFLFFLLGITALTYFIGKGQVTNAFVLRLWLFITYLTIWRNRFIAETIHPLIESENHVALRILLGSRLFPNQLQRIGDLTCLHRAAFKCDFQTVKLLLQYPKIAGNVKDTDRDGRTVLTLLLQHSVNSSFKAPGHILEMIAMFLEQGCPMNEPSWNFALAMDKMPVDICRFLVAQGANVNSQHKNGKPAIHIAIDKKSASKVKILVRERFKVKTWKDQTPLEYSIASDSNDEIISSLMDYENTSKSESERMVSFYRMKDKRHTSNQSFQNSNESNKNKSRIKDKWSLKVSPESIFT